MGQAAECCSQATSLLGLILPGIDAGDYELFCSGCGLPQLIDHTQQGQQRPFEVNSNEAAEWLTDLAFNTYKTVPDCRPVRAVLRCLAGRARRAGRSTLADPLLTRLMETDPLIATVVEFVDTQPRFAGTAEDLWKKLTKFAFERRLHKLGRKHFPRGANVLTRKLKEYGDDLVQFGIEFTNTRSNGSRVTLGRLGGSTVEPSANQSGDNSTPHHVLEQSDDSEEAMAYLQQRMTEEETK
ncbi:MAG: hypothetical protein K8U57_04090 [Planctomycetes bacterium]|nr:hypothetical protein [Planctomycetota bacterium]